MNAYNRTPPESSTVAEVRIPAGPISLDGILTVPEGAIGLVIFAHGSGSGRFSPRNRFVSDTLNHSRLATLLFDLLSADEHARDVETAEHRFDIPMLSKRLVAAVDWTARQGGAEALPVGLFGASTGAGAALIAAAERPNRVKAVVSRGGRPDLAGDALDEVQAPTLLIVGALDGEVIRLNRKAAEHLAAEHQLVLVPDATHLFEEPGTLEEVAFLAADWFERHLAGAPRQPDSGRARLRRVR